MVLTALAAALLISLSPASADIACKDASGQPYYGVLNLDGTVSRTGAGPEGAAAAKRRGGPVVHKSCKVPNGWVTELGFTVRESRVV